MKFALHFRRAKRKRRQRRSFCAANESHRASFPDTRGFSEPESCNPEIQSHPALIESCWRRRRSFGQILPPNCSHRPTRSGRNTQQLAVMTIRSKSMIQIIVARAPDWAPLAGRHL